jgi:hypothetical protein
VVVSQSVNKWVEIITKYSECVLKYNTSRIYQNNSSGRGDIRSSCSVVVGIDAEVEVVCVVLGWLLVTKDRGEELDDINRGRLCNVQASCSSSSRPRLRQGACSSVVDLAVVRDREADINNDLPFGVENSRLIQSQPTH